MKSNVPADTNVYCIIMNAVLNMLPCTSSMEHDMLNVQYIKIKRTHCVTSGSILCKVCIVFSFILYIYIYISHLKPFQHSLDPLLKWQTDKRSLNF